MSTTFGFGGVRISGSLMGLVSTWIPSGFTGLGMGLALERGIFLGGISSVCVVTVMLEFGLTISEFALASATTNTGSNSISINSQFIFNCRHKVKSKHVDEDNAYQLQLNSKVVPRPCTEFPGYIGCPILSLTISPMKMEVGDMGFVKGRYPKNTSLECLDSLAVLYMHWVILTS